VEGGIGCTGRDATVVGSGLPTAREAGQPQPPRGGYALVERRSGARAGSRTDLFDEVRAACQQVREQVVDMGPEIVQSGLLALLDLRLPETYAHARRVARASVTIARAMTLPEWDVRTIRCAALLHDIGKVAIPGRLLRHGGPLGDHEITALRMHVTIGADLVADIPSLGGVSPLIAATHERYDGSGYPSRLSGDDIPVGARIIAVADCYDAMVTPRAHCESLTREEAHNEMVRCSGSQFDPAIVREWVAIMGTWGCPVTVTPPRIARFDRASAIPILARR
jgi:putative nucleotidyltransferase with HDIG domain